ncbi:MAG: hypothetical protein U9P36_07760 [Thermodesulfobacteriota bacterium]|nr:hypothetical protein [Thermodesulfobacteriota bacterium]
MREQKTSEQIKSSGPGYLKVIIISMMMAAGVVFGYDWMFAQKIKVLDLKGYLRTQKALMAAREISEDQWKSSLDKLEQALNQEGANSNSVILLKEVVLRNGDEIIIK